MPPAPPAPPAVAAAAWFGSWSKPPDRPAQVALGVAAALAILALTPGGPRWLASLLDFASIVDAARRRRFLSVASFIAAFGSLAYLAFYLRGGPRAPEAPTYWLEGRALSHGMLSWPVGDPSASFRVKNLLFTAPDHVTGIFPPGYALLLAPAFMVGAPMVLGPVLAATLVIATWFLAREIALAAGEDNKRSDLVARLAVGLSIASAALRYHTADTVPYGATACLVALSLATALFARRTKQPRMFGSSGVAFGLLLATHPASAIATGAVLVALAVGGSPRRRSLAWWAVATLPGVLVLGAANHAAVGRWIASPVVAYHAAFEPYAPIDTHATVIAALRLLRAHLLDVANLEPLALLAILGVARGGRGARLGAIVVLGQIIVVQLLERTSLVPGPGAKLLIAAVPIEHALIAIGLARFLPVLWGRAAMGTLAFALAGFAVHASIDHEALAASDLGRSRYEPDIAREAGVSNGLLYFDDDQSFELAYDPGVPASHGIEAVRMRNDDHDRLLYDSLGHPPTHRYTSAAAASASIAFWTPPSGGGDTWRFEAEADFPPVSSSGGRASVLEVLSSCASEGHGLSLLPDPKAGPQGEAVVTIALPVPRGPTPAERKTWQVIPRVIERGGGGSGTLVLSETPGGPALATWNWVDKSVGTTCPEMPAQPVELGGERTRVWLTMHAKGGLVVLDKTTLRVR